MRKLALNDEVLLKIESGFYGPTFLLEVIP